MLDHQEFQSEDDPPDTGEEVPENETTELPASILCIPRPPQPPPTPHSGTHTTKESVKWRDNLKLGIELVGLMALVVYTIFSILQWAQIRWTNRLTREALNGSDYTLQETLKKLQGQIDATNVLAGHARDEADHAAVMATNSGIEASANKKAAEAAKNAAETAKDALHISEKAYIVFATTGLDSAKKMFFVSFTNIGHVPAGSVETVTHEATLNFVTPDPRIKVPFSGAVEKHWQRTKYPTISPTAPMGLAIPVNAVSGERIAEGLQAVVVAGTISYNDGFADEPIQKLPFCVQTAYSTVAKIVIYSPCDASVILPQMEAADGYPNNEFKD